MRPTVIKYRVDTMEAAVPLFHSISAKLAGWRVRYPKYEYNMEMASSDKKRDEVVITINVTKKDASKDDSGVYEETSWEV